MITTRFTSIILLYLTSLSGWLVFVLCCMFRICVIIVFLLSNKSFYQLKSLCTTYTFHILVFQFHNSIAILFKYQQTRQFNTELKLENISFPCMSLHSGIL